MSHQVSCIYNRREESLVGYIYQELDAEERTRFESHLAGCVVCRDELASLEEARTPLAQWIPPEPVPGLEYAMVQPAVTPRSMWARLADVPAWAQVAAAVLLLGVAVGVANLDIKYDQSGLSVRTGWAPAPSPAVAVDQEQWRTEMAALAAQLRAELEQTRTAPATTASTPAPAEITPAVRALLEESERRQRRELALRVAQVLQDVDSQRRADHERIQYNLGMMDARVLDLNDAMIRVSQQPVR